MKFTKIVALLLALCMVCSLAVACDDNTNTDDKKNNPVVDNKGDEKDNNGDDAVDTPDDNAAAFAPIDLTGKTHAEASEILYDAVLGDFYDVYTAAKTSASSVSERFALMAVAEAKLLEAGVMLPSTARGGNYAISKIIPGTVCPTFWGTDADRYHNALIVNENPLTPDERAELKAKWAELKGTGTYEQWAKDWAAGKGYTLASEYTLGYVSDPVTWDVFNTYEAADFEAIVNTYDGLLEYNGEEMQMPALATSYDVSEDGLKYTFHLREGVKWVNNQGVEIEDVTAKSFVAGFQHLLDARGGCEYLVGETGCNILNADAYMAGDITDFSEVGVKAIDDYTLEYTLAAPCSFFTTMFSYGVFAPLCESFFLSQGGAFGLDAYAEAAASENYTYGTSPETIAYCGAYLVTSYAATNSIVYEANPLYWNKDNITIKKITWRFLDGQNPTESYDLFMEGTFAGAGLNTNAVAKAKQDGMFDKYAYVAATDAHSYPLFFNLYRCQYVNFNDETIAVSALTDEEKDRANVAMQNLHFRRALSFGLDRAAYNATTTSDDLKLTSLVNSYTPGNFVYLDEDVTIDINGTATTFAAGTYYGAIMQAQMDADGFPVKVWDPTLEDGIGSSAGYDGWYNVDNCRAELETAIAELASVGITVDKDNPIKLDLPYYDINEVYSNRANALKKSIEASTEGKIIINLVKTGGSNALNWYNAASYPDTGDHMNFHISDVSGWGPDYGDPATYLDTMLPQGGGMAKNLGLY